MKKALAVVLFASVLFISSNAIAAEDEDADAPDLKIDGSLILQYRHDNIYKEPLPGRYDGVQTLVTVNIRQKLTDHLDFYTRATYETLGGGLNPATNGKVIDGVYTGYSGSQDYIDKRYNGAFDAVGFTLKADEWTWTVGSQALTIGQGLIYDNSNIGRHALPYAVDGKGKIGVLDTEIFTAKTNYQSAIAANDKFSGIVVGYDITPKANIGAFYTRWAAGSTATYPDSVARLNFIGVDATYRLNKKVTFNGEIVRSNASVSNNAYLGGVSYAFDKIDTVSLSAYRSEDLSDINDANLSGMTTAPDANTKGFIFSWSHKMGENISLKVDYDRYTHLNEAAVTGTTNDRDRTTVGLTYTF